MKILIIPFLLVTMFIQAQELNCSVKLNYDNITRADKSKFSYMEKEIKSFLNTNIWTSHKFAENEKVSMSVLITLTEEKDQMDYTGTIDIYSTRPVYGASLNTSILSFKDKDFSFKFVDNDNIEFSENNYTSNLASVLSFYGYLVLGLDYDTFSENGGSEFYQKALNVATLAQTGGMTGWMSNEKKQNNRYNIIMDLLNSKYSDYHKALYQYHLKGLDLMHSDVSAGRKNVLSALKLLQPINQGNTAVVQILFDAKTDEIAEMFQKATPAEKQELMPILKKIAPSRMNKFKGLE